MTASRSVANRGQVRTSTRGVVLSWWCLGRIVCLAVNGAATVGATLSFLLGLALVVFLLLASFPFLTNLFEFYDVPSYISIDPR